MTALRFSMILIKSIEARIFRSIAFSPNCPSAIYFSVKTAADFLTAVCSSGKKEYGCIMEEKGK